MDDLSSRFLSAYNEIDRFLRRLGGHGQEVPFMKVLQEAQGKDSGVRSHFVDLKEFAHLRNAVTHTYRNYQSIATPTVEAVTEIESIKSKLLTPARLIEHFAKQVEVCQVGETVAAAAMKMKVGDFSQLPVYDDGSFVHLLTGETIARWFADRMTADGGRLSSDTVADALAFTEPSTTYEIVGDGATVYDALGLFERAYLKGDSLDAILMTPNGNKAEVPTGIVTIFDVPRLRSLI